MTSYDDVIAAISDRPTDSCTVIAVCNVHSVMSARRDERLLEAISEAEIATPDGVPIVWGLRGTERKEQQRVYGPELMRLAMVRSEELGWNHYFYGSTPETLAQLDAAVQAMAPHARIVGSESPPFRDMTDDETSAAIDRIRSSGADVVWVGLGMPKQELWMYDMRSELPGIAVIGVGAAFDFIAGTKKQAPDWMQRAGLEWLFRFVQEPRRLWRRYLWNNPAYLMLLGEQIARSKLKGSG